MTTRRRSAALAVATVLALAATAAPAGAQDRGAPELAAGDRVFLAVSAQSGLTEIFQGLMAQQLAEDPGVREHGQMMVRDHFVQVVTQLPVHLYYRVPVAPPSLEVQAQLAALAQLRGAAFDRAYATAQVAAHQATLSHFRAAAATADNALVRVLAAAQVPVLEMHLEMAQELHDRLVGDPAGSMEMAPA